MTFQSVHVRRDELKQRNVNTDRFNVNWYYYTRHGTDPQITEFHKLQSLI